jgi:integrase
VAQFLAAWLEDRKPRLQPSTVRSYTDLIRLHIEPKIGHLYASAITKDMVVDVMDPLTLRLKHLVRDVMKSAYSQAVMRGIMPRNPVAEIGRPAALERRLQPLNRIQVKKFLKAADGDRFYPLFLLAVTTGMRRGELLGLRWSDVDLDRRFISVQRAVTALVGKVAVSPLKTPRSRRRVELGQTAIEALQKHKHTADWVFPNTLGAPMSPLNLYRRYFLPLLEKAELPRVRFHDLRHSAATMMLEAGIHPKIVSETLGHASVATTLDIYSHISPTMGRQAASKMDALLR